MISFPQIKRCPCCGTANLMGIKNENLENPYKSFEGWIIKKKFSCRGCKEQIIYFTKDSNKIKKLLWVDDLKCDEIYYDKLNKLQKRKNKLSKNLNSKYYEIVDQIQEIQNQIRTDKIKLKIKLKIQKRTPLLD